MIFLRLHLAKNEEIEAEASRGKLGNFAIVEKFSLCIAISLHSEFSLL